MSSSRKRKQLLTLFFLLLLLLTGCKKKSDNLEFSLYEAVLYQKSSAIKEIEKAALSQFQLDSLKSILIQNNTVNDSIQFSDKQGKWTLGIDTSVQTTKQKPLPLIIYLHGGIGTQCTNKGYRAYEMMQFLNKDSKQPYLLASPSGNRNATWWSPTGIERILFTYRYMSLHHSVDPTRVYLAGVSDGGTAIFAIASQRKHPFSAFISISGFGGLLPRLGFVLNYSQLKKTPIYMIDGGQDHLYPLQRVKQFTNLLKANKSLLKTSFHPLEGHGFTYKNREIVNILTFLQSNCNTDKRNYLYSNMLE